MVLEDQDGRDQVADQAGHGDGVRREPRLDQAVAGELAHLSGGAGSLTSTAGSRPARPLADVVAHACALAPAVRQAQASGRARANAALAAYAEAAATSAPSAASSQKWFAVTITTKVTTSG